MAIALPVYGAGHAIQRAGEAVQRTVGNSFIGTAALGVNR
jgi:hypothetical protein